MPKTYPEELAEWVKGREAKKPSQNRLVAFLAVKSDVQAALDAGYAMKTIWEHLKETNRLRGRYETFTQHVKRYIKAVPVAALPPTAQPTPAPKSPPRPTSSRPVAAPMPAAPAPASSSPERASKLGEIAGFIFNPIPNKEELL